MSALRIGVVAAALALLWLVAPEAVAAPTASFSYSPQSPQPGEQVTFTSTSTPAPGETITVYSWDLDGDGTYGESGEPSGSTADTASRSFPSAGDYTVGLSVQDGSGTDTARRVVRVRSAPAPEPQRPPQLIPLERRVLPVPLLSFADDDGDRVSNALDLCPTTPPGVRSVRRGCALFEFIVAPAALIEPAADAVADAREELRQLSSLRSAQIARTRASRRFTRALRAVRRAARHLRRRPCRAARRARRGVRHANKGVRAVSRAVRKRQRAIRRKATRDIRKRRRRGGDGSHLDVRFYSLEFARVQARRARRELRRLQRLMRRVCRGSRGRRRVRSRVVSISADGTLVRLRNGTTLILRGAGRSPALGRGVVVRARGLALKRRVRVARAAAKPKKFSSPKALVAESVVARAGKVAAGCSFVPWISPVQAAFNANAVFHDERGYREGEKYRLEGGMGIGASLAGLCPDKNYKFVVSLDYRDTDGDDTTVTLGSLGAGTTPVGRAQLPNNVDPTKDATLRIQLFSLNCGIEVDINTSVCLSSHVSTRSFKAEIRRQGAWGSIDYSKTLFSIEDGSKADFETATLSGVNAPSLPGAKMFGFGYKPQGQGSSYPNADYIQPGQSFAVHDDVPGTIAPSEWTDGVVGVPAGMLGAYIDGSRGGHPYQYVARQDDIVTDRVTTCSPGPDSFYRLPWANGTTEAVTQGNNGMLTHNGGQAFAFDFVLSNGEKGHATRGGRVDFLVESRTATSNPTNNPPDPWVPGNVLRIAHQDGTFSWYEHMQQNGVAPGTGSIVTRGDQIITIGNTGNSTGAHVHYHVTTVQGADNAAGGNASRGGTIQIRFEIGSPTQTCVIPVGSTNYVSTNAKPAS